MSTEVTIPAVGESITSANIAKWHKATGDYVKKGETILTIETDKISTEIEATTSGIITINVDADTEVGIGTVVAVIEKADASAAPQQAAPAESDAPSENHGKSVDVVVPAAGESITSANIAQWHASTGQVVEKGSVIATLDTDKVSTEIEADETGVINIIAPEGEEVPIGTVIASILVGGSAEKRSSTSTPEKKEAVAETPAPVAAPAKPAPAPAPAKPAPAPVATPAPAPKPKAELAASTGEKAGSPRPDSDGRYTRTKMSMLRRKIASHLVNAQQTAAILTTFNECNMSSVMQLRKSVQDDFVSKHGVKLGFMSFFVKATVQALKDVPQINASIEGTDIVQNNFYDIGVAIGTEKGLVVPVLRDCDKKSFAEIENEIIAYAIKAKEGKITMEDLQGGVFTISNGGVYGSLLSTPILSPPQSGILGMHTIQQRPIAENGQVVIAPMMNLALSYDHRLVDGKEAVTFLIRIKDCIENPSRLMLEM
ncbi:dihydrolipoyllysine-residue succinyltransferase [Persicirhabdus sediminis]|uniref:Dihydrolipoyllysine-residue succinyltransferase n=1 Tax=Persicirhabdus sediminis TaxID=454144 RepID=A0A8J7MDB0_9BACT|nr:dihydrolipoyllysine-residue succinyltransferase [Persicirhabdus sediminis]MBK1790492.1 dihydrolipoyllysine-residue succinyltransferase [Persicirhabdus sediminis]